MDDLNQFQQQNLQTAHESMEHAKPLNVFAPFVCVMCGAPVSVRTLRFYNNDFLSVLCQADQVKVRENVEELTRMK